MVSRRFRSNNSLTWGGEGQRYHTCSLIQQFTSPHCTQNIHVRLQDAKAFKNCWLYSPGFYKTTREMSHKSNHYLCLSKSGTNAAARIKSCMHEPSVTGVTADRLCQARGTYISFLPPMPFAIDSILLRSSFSPKHLSCTV